MKSIKTLIAGCLASAVLVLGSCSSAGNASSSTSKKGYYPEEKLGWKLGSQAYTFRLFTFAEAINKVDSAGLRYIESFPGQPIGAGSKESMTYNLSPEGRQFVKNLLKEKGVTVSAYGVVGGANEEEWEKIFQFAKDFDIKVINSEPGENQLDFLSKLCDKYNIKLAIHNHPKPSHYWNPDVVLKAIEGRSKLMGAAADVGHWMRSGLDPIECLKKLEGRIFHLHFKDLNEFGKGNAHDVHWGTGKLGLKAVQDELKRQKFQGMISAEYEYNWNNNMNDVKISAANFRAALK